MIKLGFEDVSVVTFGRDDFHTCITVPTLRRNLLPPMLQKVEAIYGPETSVHIPE
jgi:hypothetical protein